MENVNMYTALQQLLNNLDKGAETIKECGSSLKKNGDPLFIRKKPGYLILEGDLDYRSLAELGQIVKENKPNDKYLVIDVRGLNYIDSAGIGFLVEVQKMLKSENKSLKIVNMRGDVKRVMGIVGLNNFLGVIP